MTTCVHHFPFKWLHMDVLEHLNSLISGDILIAFKLEGKAFIEYPYMFLLM